LEKRLHEIEYSHSNKQLFLVFEFMDSDLRRALEKVCDADLQTAIKVRFLRI